MSLIPTLLPSLYPVYNDELDLTVTDTDATADFTYEFSIDVNNELVDVFTYYAEPTAPHSATINMNYILQSYFTSEVPTITGSTIFTPIENSIISYKISIKSYNANGVENQSLVLPTKWVFNGAVDKQDKFDMDDYIFPIEGTNKANFLTNWHTDRFITLNDKAYLTTIIGDYGVYETEFSGIEITRYQKDFTISSVVFTNTDNTTKALLNIDVSPSTINNTHTDFINSNTLYYTVKEKYNTEKQIMKINLIENKRHSDYYNFLYINKLGGVDFFTTTAISLKDYSIEKETLDQFVTKKVYNVSINEEINTNTGYISYYQNNKLKDFFTSIDVKVWNNDLLSSVIINNTDFVVRKRYPKTDLISLNINFSYNNKKYIQKY